LAWIIALKFMKVCVSVVNLHASEIFK
jgi:hypothetical protein